MKMPVCSLIAILTLGGTLAAAPPQGRGRGGDEHASHVQRQAPSGQVHVVFSSREVEAIRTHYAPRYRNLPPGLQKKLARTGQLPPGWQKKMEPFPVELERRLAVLPDGYHRGVIDGHAVIYQGTSALIIDVAALF